MWLGDRTLGQNEEPILVSSCWLICNPWGMCVALLSSALLMEIGKVIDKLGLSYRTPKELNDIIDTELPGCPQFKCEDLTIAGNTLQFYFRDIPQCIQSLYGDPEFVHTWCLHQSATTPMSWMYDFKILFITCTITSRSYDWRTFTSHMTLFIQVMTPFVLTWLTHIRSHPDSFYYTWLWLTISESLWLDTHTVRWLILG